uniref:Uncharacterized protein n=1 Tax=Glycine max TaxID=3847 RepID=K7MQN8_SOYBN
MRNNFECHALITVSQSYSAKGLLRRMSDELCKEKKEDPPKDVSTIKSLTKEVRNRLCNKRYVVLFHDIGNEKFWDHIESAVVDDKNGSRILITTRDEKVAEFCMKSSFVEAFQYSSYGDCPEELEDMSLDIVRKCKGLPLAIVAIGGLLSQKDESAPEWKQFSENLSLDQLERNSELNMSITKILGLSYEDLPSNVRSCLLYFGMYPEDYEVRSDRLIGHWIAEGFVKHETGKTLEEVAQQYLSGLVGRSLVQVSSLRIDGKVKRCHVHDLIHDMILKKIQDTGFCQYIGRHDQSMSSTGLSYVPQNLGNSCHLKYLSFRNTGIEILPKSIGKLQNLEISRLKMLRHLLADSTCSIQWKDIGGMTSLHEIPTVTIDDDGVVFREVEKLKQLRNLMVVNFRGKHLKTLCSLINDMPLLEKLAIGAADESEVIDLYLMSPMSTLRKLFQNLVQLYLAGSKLTNDALKSLKDMPRLMFLCFAHNAYEGQTLHFERGWFQKVKTLHVICLDKLKSILIDRGALCSLEEIVLRDLSQLKTVPSGIQHLEKLKDLYIVDMPTGFEQRIAPDGGQDYWIIQDVPHVGIWSRDAEEPLHIFGRSHH